MSTRAGVARVTRPILVSSPLRVGFIDRAVCAVCTGHPAGVCVRQEPTERAHLPASGLGAHSAVEHDAYVVGVMPTYMSPLQRCWPKAKDGASPGDTVVVPNTAPTLVLVLAMVLGAELLSMLVVAISRPRGVVSSHVALRAQGSKEILEAQTLSGCRDYLRSFNASPP
jgi:hypothetical protein